ncbi:GNAT family N-acetyltransferase [Virgibacillus flavescens]|uniref:GNAT family N-acetyltransferase n=1 Tax=Virgibacillus flavescens TaxID=1611422 RepID=UPI003D34581D
MKPESIYRNIPTLETERIILRKITMDDAQDLFEYASEAVVSRYVPWEAHNSIEDSRAFLEYITTAYEQNKKLTWAIELKTENKMIGTIDFVNWIPKHFKAEITYVLSHKYWGRGLTQEAAKELLKYGFESMQLNRVEAPIMVGNIQSQRVLEKLGMKYEGLARESFVMNGEFLDLAMYSILKDEFT